MNRFASPVPGILLQLVSIPLILGMVVACQSPGQVAAGIVAGTAIGGVIPGSGLEQTYYLGIYDPRDQVPQAFYRITVRGQASMINTQTRFASGWVPAALIDGLSSDVSAKLSGGPVEVSGSSLNVPELTDPVKRMFLLGPEGIRVSPGGHRLVIVMGSSPEKFFAAVDEALGTLSLVEVEEADRTTRDAITREYRRLQDEREELQALKLRVADESIRRTKEAR